MTRGTRILVPGTNGQGTKASQIMAKYKEKIKRVTGQGSICQWHHGQGKTKCLVGQGIRSSRVNA